MKKTMKLICAALIAVATISTAFAKSGKNRLYPSLDKHGGYFVNLFYETMHGFRKPSPKARENNGAN